MAKEKPIYVIGHRNPDTDSICSAIAYAYFKQQRGYDTVPARAGKVNAETKFALEYFDVEQPLLLSDIYPRVKDITLDQTTTVSTSDNLKYLGDIMRHYRLKSVPVVDENEELVGIVSVSDLANRYFEEMSLTDLTGTGVTIDDIVNVIDARYYHVVDRQMVVRGGIRIAAGSIDSIKRHVGPRDIVLIGDRFDESLIQCIKQEIDCLIVTSGGFISKEVITEAKKHNVTVIGTLYDTYSCARLVNQSIPVKSIMQARPVCFKPLDLLSDIKEIMEQHKYRSYPVIENGKIIGSVARDQIVQPDKDRLILVDHNERGQAVEGVEYAKILEIIDHHRLGGMQTSEPIYTHQEPVGCTATIVSSMYWGYNIDIPKHIAGLLLSAILSDTVLFKSPTCTEIDENTAHRLAEIAGVDVKEYGLAMLKAGADIGDMSAAEIARNDLKEFTIGDYKVIVGQISVMDTESVMKLKDELVDTMKKTNENEGFDMSLLMITDIINEATDLIFVGQPMTLISEAFGAPTGENYVHLPGVMSRKKQVIPPLSEAVVRL